MEPSGYPVFLCSGVPFKTTFFLPRFLHQDLISPDAIANEPYPRPTVAVVIGGITG